jgi:hypothetical protein
MVPMHTWSGGTHALTNNPMAGNDIIGGASADDVLAGGGGDDRIFGRGGNDVLWGDAGMFELNFRDERYLPFEGAGAISEWRLEFLQRFGFLTMPLTQTR